MNTRLGTLLTGIATEVRVVLRWWLHELQEAWHAALTIILPRHADRVWILIGDNGAQMRWRQNGCEHEGPLLSDTGSWEQVVAMVSTALAGVRPGIRTRVQLGLSRVLLRDIVLPEVAERDLAAILALQAERVLPLPLGAMYIDWRVKQRLPERRHIVVTVAVAKRQELDTLRDRIVQMGLRVDEISAGGAPEKPTYKFFRLHVPQHTAGWENNDRALTVSFAIVILVWCSMFFGRMVYEHHRIADIVADAHARAQSARQLEREIRARVVPIDRVQNLLTTPGATDAIAVLTQAIPSDTWVYSAEISGGSTGTTLGVKLAGFTPTATMLVDNLSKNSALQSVKLVKATGTSGGIGIDRFEISAQLSRADGSTTPQRKSP